MQLKHGLDIGVNLLKYEFWLFISVEIYTPIFTNLLQLWCTPTGHMMETSDMWISPYIHEPIATGERTHWSPC